MRRNPHFWTEVRRTEIIDWDQPNVRALSAPPSAHLLYRFITTGWPAAGVIPGLGRFFAGTAAEYFGWTHEETQRVFEEIIDAGLAAFDPSTNWLWVYDRVLIDRPPSPNAVRRWRREWNSIPPSPMKEAAEASFLEALAEIGPGFVEAFMQVCGRKPSSPAPNGRGLGAVCRESTRRGAPSGSPIMRRVTMRSQPGTSSSRGEGVR